MTRWSCIVSAVFWLLLVTPLAGSQQAATTAPQSSAPATSFEPMLPPLLAQDVYKNIQIFRDKPATSVLPAMDGLRHMLGVDCSWCHKLYQWEKDDLKPKQTARMMFHMVDFINTSTFGGAERVNCWTCHRSQPVPASLPHATAPTPELVAAQMFIRFKPEQAQKPAEQVFHNIKVLRGVPAQKLPLVMAFFSRSLGVRCMFCHNLDDFPSDEKPPKRMARRMLAMIHGISTNFYNGETPVECYNCHQGHEKPPEGFGEPPAPARRRHK